MNSDLRSEPDSVLDGSEVLESVGNVKLLKDEGKGRIVSADALYGGLEGEKASLLHSGCDFGSESAGLGRLVGDDEASCLGDGLDDGVDVPGRDRSQVDELDGYAELG